MHAVFRIDFDSSLFDGLLIRTLFHRCAQCFVDMILFDPTSASVKSYQLVEVVSGGRAPGKSSSLASPQLLVIGRFHCFGAVRLPSAAAASCCCCCFRLLLLLPPADAAASSCCCCLLLLLLLPPAAAASCCCCCFLLLLLLLPPPPPAAAAAGANILPKKKITVSVALFGDTGGRRQQREGMFTEGRTYETFKRKRMLTAVCHWVFRF